MQPGLPNLGIVSRFDEYSFAPRPVSDVRLRLPRNAFGRPVREIQLSFEPQRDGSRYKVGPMTHSRSEPILKHILLAAVNLDRSPLQVREEGFRPFGFARDHTVGRSIEHKGRAT